ncbi:MAG: single-stranded DNA-binding protein [Peptostreptococcales bacterium]
MDENIINSCTVSGKVCSDLKMSHKSYGEGFYTFDIEIRRLSGYMDIIPVTLSERLILNMQIEKGDEVEIIGQLRTYNKMENGKNRLIISVFAREIYRVEDEAASKNPNKVFLEGYICKEPIYRLTPLGREICDIMLAVNRAYNKSDYIPCISWGRNAKYSKILDIGAHVRIIGRIQSRVYKKKYDEDNIENKVAYEVSVLKMESI